MLSASTTILPARSLRTSNRIRGLLTGIPAELERIEGPHLDHPAMPLLDERNAVGQPARQARPEDRKAMGAEIVQALSEQTVMSWELRRQRSSCLALHSNWRHCDVSATK